MSELHALPDMPVIPSDYGEALFQGFLHIAAAGRHPANPNWQAIPFDGDEVEDVWPLVGPEPLEDSELAWAEDMAQENIESWT